MKILKSITICLPKKESDFENSLISFLSNFGRNKENSIVFQKSDKSYNPQIDLKFGDFEVPFVRFNALEDIKIDLINKTGQFKKSPYDHSPISIHDFINRAKGLKFEFLDHIGFDIPWFAGVHPEIKELRKSLSSQSLYYLYPTGENWDFIIPATKEEILAREVNYKAIRRPKFEIVSLDDSSKPIIQFDISVKENFDEIKKLYPEGIPDNFLENVWIYINNPYGLNICFVIGQRSYEDWYKFLETGLLNPNKEK